jgi:serine phosphatase RsbU (regulator of sigma subunit)
MPGTVYGELRIALEPGDVVVFASDGLVEARAAEITSFPSHSSVAASKPGAFFGFERLAASVTRWAALATSAEGIMRGIWEEVTDWCTGSTLEDDATLLVLRVPTRAEVDREGHR